MKHLDHVTIPIGGFWILLNIEDVWRVMEHNWYPSSKGDYLQSTQDGQMVLLHRFIIEAGPSDYVDHRNGNRWDCRRKNLRLATATENARNARAQTNCSSPYKGVSLVERKSGPRYRVGIQVDGRPKYLGIFLSETQAARAYDAAARKHFGEFAWVNFND